VKGLAKACGKHCPDAVLNIISNPVNSTVPIAAETLKAMGTYDKRKVMGVTTLDVVRAKTFYAEKAGLDVKVWVWIWRTLTVRFRIQDLAYAGQSPCQRLTKCLRFGPPFC
jgi:hypothetical protein